MCEIGGKRFALVTANIVEKCVSNLHSMLKCAFSNKDGYLISWYLLESRSRQVNQESYGRISHWHMGLHHQNLH